MTLPEKSWKLLGALKLKKMANPANYLSRRQLLIGLVVAFTVFCLHRASAEVEFQVRTVKAVYRSNEPCIIECRFINRGAVAEFLDTGFQGVHQFSFESKERTHAENRVYPQGGLDFGERQVLIQPGKECVVVLALNGWLALDAGTHSLVCKFRSKMINGSAAFTVKILERDGDLRESLKYWFPYFGKLGSSSAQFDFARVLASVCVQNRSCLATFQEFSQQKELSKQERDFYSTIVWQAKQSWNAID